MFDGDRVESFGRMLMFQRIDILLFQHMLTTRDTLEYCSIKRFYP